MQENNKPNENLLVNKSYVSDGSTHKSHQNAFLNQYRSLNGGIKPKEQTVVISMGEQKKVNPVSSSIPSEVKTVSDSKPQIKQNSSLSRVSSGDIRYGLRGNSQIKSNKSQNLTIKVQKKSNVELKTNELKDKNIKATSHLEGVKKASEEIKETPKSSHTVDAFSSYQINFFKGKSIQQLSTYRFDQ